MKKKLLIGLVLGLFVVQPAFAGTINWTDWTSATAGPSGSATGTISSTGGTDITVNYTGDITFAQTGTGTNYWVEFSPPPYTGNPTVDNAPPGGEMIALARSGITNTLTFSQAVDNPIMAIVSLGRSNVPISYDFDTSFTVLGEGRGAFGDGTYTLSAGDILTGKELHGVIQFNGSISQVSWTASADEYWHGFTIGLPEPATLLLLSLGSLALLKKRKA